MSTSSVVEGSMQLIHKVAGQHISIPVLMPKDYGFYIIILRCEGVSKEESHIILREILYRIICSSWCKESKNISLHKLGTWIHFVQNVHKFWVFGFGFLVCFFFVLLASSAAFLID